jgi:hypothetical protein
MPDGAILRPGETFAGYRAVREHARLKAALEALGGPVVEQSGPANCPISRVS